MTQENELLDALKEYVRNDDVPLHLNGIKTKAIATIAKAEQAERVEPVAYNDPILVGQKTPKRVMGRGYALCPTGLPHLDRMAWIADYYERNRDTTPPAAAVSEPNKLQRHNDYMAGFNEGYDRAERGDVNLQTYKQAIKQVRGLNEQIALLEGTLDSRERNIEMLKANIKMLHDALQTCRVMGADAQGNYTKEITPKIIRDALEATK